MRALSLVGNNIADLEPLSGLMGLRELEIGEPNVTDLEPLSALTNLESLFIHNTRANNLEPLSYLTGLTGLNLLGNNISDIGTLSNLPNLEWLYLMDNNVSEIGTLSDLTNLQWVRLGNNNISDLRPLSELSDSLWFDANDQIVSTNQIFYRDGSLVSIVANQWNINDFSGTVVVELASIAAVNNVLSDNSADNRIVIPATASTEEGIVSAVEYALNNVDGLSDNVTVTLDTDVAVFETGRISYVSIVLTQNPTHIITNQIIYWQYAIIDPAPVEPIPVVTRSVIPNNDAIDSVARLPQAGASSFDSASTGVSLLAIAGVAIWAKMKKHA